MTIDDYAEIQIPGLAEGYRVRANHVSGALGQAWQIAFTRAARAETLRVLDLKRTYPDLPDGYETAEHLEAMIAWSSKVIEDALLGVLYPDDSLLDREASGQFVSRIGAQEQIMLALSMMREVGRLPPQFRPPRAGVGDEGES